MNAANNYWLTSTELSTEIEFDVMQMAHAMGYLEKDAFVACGYRVGGRRGDGTYFECTHYMRKPDVAFLQGYVAGRLAAEAEAATATAMNERGDV